MTGFAEFFEAIHGFEPFPWQQMLAEQVADSGKWPAVIDLPTASGKTAVIDIAIWHLAQQAHLPPQQRRAPRRIWFVVDRRIVVDEAYQRAQKIAAKLADRVCPQIADALYEVSGFGDRRDSMPPLSYGRLRGGVLRDSGWASFPSQPAILTSTVDQFGSRLLFRGYGMGSGMWPVHAALAGNDTLLVLDEAHLSEPLRQTLEAFQRYRDGRRKNGERRWCEQPIALPWQMTLMSATPPPDSEDRFPSSEQRPVALNHSRLRERTGASKIAKLVPVDKPKVGKTTKRPPAVCNGEAVTAAEQFIEAGRRRIAVMMNRVDAAMAVHADLAKRDDIDAVLLTGRMRPFDRDRLIEQWQCTLRAGSDVVPDKPIVLVTTQCLEVGADFSFDALVTECASIDALRQRFGRLDRFGELGHTEAAILAWHGDTDGSRVDPIYGQALGEAWRWLNDHADDQAIDFGIAAIDARLRGADLEPMLPPRPDAPILLPAYLDAWCQTGPRPHVEAEPALFLHGKQASDPDVQVGFRADLTETLHNKDWEEIVQATPPASAELLTVPLHRLRQWLKHQPVAADGDVEGGGDDGGQAAADPPPQRWVRYLGQGEKTLCMRKAENIHPGDVIILPAEALQRIPRALGHGDEFSSIDILEQAVEQSSRPQTLRLTRRFVRQWANNCPDLDVEPLIAWIDPDAPDRTLTREQWDELAPILVELLPEPLRPVLQALKSNQSLPRFADHPDGVVLIGPRRKTPDAEFDPFAEEDEMFSLIGEPVPLDAHARQVADLARRSAAQCVPDHSQVLEQAALWHDRGKDEPRFQALLRGESAAYFGDPPLAKSGRPASPRDQRLRKQLGIDGFRHEMLSLQCAAAQSDDELLLHLIASHHGHARPFAPVFEDAIWSDPPPHHLGSGVAERFWTLTRRYGWWGLAYLEAILRLADQHASRFPVIPADQEQLHAEEAHHG